MTAPVARCEVRLVEANGRLWSCDEHVAVLFSEGTPRKWLYAADIVGLPVGGNRSTYEILDRLPGCRVAVELGGNPVVHVRGTPGPMSVPDLGAAGVVAALAYSWPTEWGALGTGLRGARISAGSCREGNPTVSVSLRHGGRTARCRWTTPR